MIQTNDLRIRGVDPLVPPAALKKEFPISDESSRLVSESRRVIEAIIARRDPRLLVVVGPCSIHDPAAALEYAGRLLALRKRFGRRVYVVMRVYFEKPRTRLGWRGLILDPDLDGSGDIQNGLRVARKLLVEITELGVPVGSEMLDPIVPQYTSDLVSWAAIGARTTESQTHRDMASGLSMPVGFKNGTDGRIDVAINAMSTARHQHSFIGIDQEGRTCVLNTNGNEYSHLILRGGRGGPNYHDEQIEDTCAELVEAGFSPTVMVDCSHANSLKQQTRQERVFRSIVRQRREGQTGLMGVMLESNLLEGRQDIPEDLTRLAYGVSITDSCIGWDETERLITWADEQLSDVIQRD